MSRRLRGQTTLQSLIGRSTTSKKAVASQRAKRAGAAALQLPSTSAPVTPTPQAAPEDDPISLPPEKPSLPPGSIACPVCGIGLGTELGHMNLHLGIPKTLTTPCHVLSVSLIYMSRCEGVWSNAACLFQVVINSISMLHHRKCPVTRKLHCAYVPIVIAADKCLAQQASSRGKSQSTLSQFSSREKRPRVSKAESAPQELKQADAGPGGSPQRKAPPPSSPLRTR